MNSRKILAVDYDETLKQNGRVSEQNREAVKRFQQAGNILVLDTGRNFIDTVAAVDECGIKFDYICPLCGNLLYDCKTDTIIDEIHSYMNDFPGIIKLISEMKPLFVRRYYLKSGIFLKLLNNQYEKESEGFTGCSIEEFNDNGIPFSLLICKFESPSSAKKAADRLCKVYKKGLIYSHESFVDILPKNGGKAFGLEKLADHFGISKDNIFAIGDSSVDLQMITEFNGYFVDTAPERFVKKSDGTYKDVASLIEDILL